MKARADFSVYRCSLPGVEATAAATRRSLARHMHAQFGFGLMTAGGHRSASCHGMVEAMAGDIITVNAGEIHDGTPLGHGLRAWQMLYVDPDVFSESVSQITEGKTTNAEFLAPVLRLPGFRLRFQEFFTLVTGDLPSHSLMLMRAEELLLSLLAESLRVRGPDADSGKVPHALSHALRMADDMPSAALSLDDLAQVSGLSRFQVLRGFAKATGLTPHAYLVQRRAQLARRLIGQGLPLAQAALESGFADQSHMTRVFMRQYGVSPAMYAALAV